MPKISSSLVCRFGLYGIFSLWLYIACANFYVVSMPQFLQFMVLSRLPTEQKQQLVESKPYYNTMLFCNRAIPEHGEIVCINVIEDQLTPHSKLWLRSEYYVEKARYYLFPRKVYKARDCNPLTKEFAIYFNPQTEQFMVLHSGEKIYVSN